MTGSIVLTGYNNETYRVDDVDFNVTPSCTFKGKDGDVSYIQYYKQVIGRVGEGRRRGV